MQGNDIVHLTLLAPFVHPYSNRKNKLNVFCYLIVNIQIIRNVIQLAWDKLIAHIIVSLTILNIKQKHAQLYLHVYYMMCVQ